MPLLATIVNTKIEESESESEPSKSEQPIS